MKIDSMNYAVIVEPAGEGEQGFYAVFPDLPGCMGDGDTPEEAIADARQAFAAWMEVQADRVDELPVPGSSLAEAEIEKGHLLERLAELQGELEDANARIRALEAEKGRWAVDKSYKSRSKTLVGSGIWTKARAIA